jgi:manganese oxidase
MRCAFLFVLVCLCLLAAVDPVLARTRTYYIAADEIIWNFAPLGRDVIGNKPLPPLAPLQLGWVYRKAAYREYTDATFRTLRPRPANEAYLGLFGPILRAEVGDTIIIVFKNNTRFHMSVHAHGMLYDKASEGALYADGAPAKDKLNDAVPPGRKYTYSWHVPERAGPGPGDPSSVAWMFHSHTDEVHDVNTGPVGSIVVTAREMAKADGSPKDVDREAFVFFAEEDEQQSRFVNANIADGRINPRHLKFNATRFRFMNQFFSINGFVYGNMPLVSMRKGDRVRWYVMTTMSDFDFHTPHWHGNTLLVDGMRTDLFSTGPMEMKTADMIPDSPGVWLLHCHVNLHLDGGMEARYEVLK